jgi:glucose/arabinose dehydrogenase
VHGRPVGIAILPDGSMLISDDVSNVIWRITPDK